AAADFTQVRPDEGTPATERTEVRVAYDATHLYIGVVCYDSQPDALAISDSRRDPALEEEDSIRVVLDSFYDQQNGFVFGTNVGGAEYDGQMTSQGRGQTPSFGNTGPGRGGAANLDWDTSWTVHTRTSEIGWSAEMAIPFRSLRYGANEKWGINFERNIRRKSETSFWAPLGREFDLYRVSRAGDLVGLEPPARRSLQVVPYALVEARDDGVTDREEDFEWGVDVKYGLTSSLTLDVTYNTDFAQVEADDQQINLDRFSLFFPEKRPFFLENAGYFTVGTTGSRFPGSGFVDLFFSRRIGLDDDGVVPILGGVRVSGKAAGLNVGFLDMQTEAIGDIHANNFAVGRLSREFGNRGRAGFILLNREGTGSLAPDDDYNRTFGVDGQIGIGRFVDLSGFAARTSTPGLDDRDHAFALEFRQESPFWRNRASYSEVGTDFNPEVGFVNRSDYRRFTTQLGRRVRPTGSRIQEWGPRLFYDHYRDFSGFTVTRRFSAGGEVETRSGARVTLFIGEALEGLTEPFEIYDGIVLEPGTYRTPKPYLFMFLNSSRSRAVSIGGRVQAGGFFDGEQLSLNPVLNIRLGDYLTSEIGWSYNDVDLPAGSFETNLGRLRLTYAFSTEILLQALIQYNDVTDDVSTNLRFSWLGTANTGLFVVYNEISEFGAMALPNPDRSLIIKYSRLFDIFR
ncbi:MAG: DUF5916 domain-containing protein, partial [Thermoanaerobaculia bacterium]|nr:DUF5916 domain-containing protein [Thermoanaerobaculia bacterium]